MVSAPGALLDPTGPLAPNAYGDDASPAIVAAEQDLVDYLNRPTQDILGALPLQQFSDERPAGPAGPDTFDPSQVITPVLDTLGSLATGLISALDPIGLIRPVVNALGALGIGVFSGTDPTQVFSGVSNAFDRTAGTLGPAMGALTHDWQGGSGEAAGAKTRAAVANGAGVATQADGLRENLSTAAAAIAQARSRMIDIIDRFQATMAAVDVTTPAGRSAAIAAANRATADSAEVMNALQRELRAYAEEAEKIGAPVPVTAAPEAAPKTPAESKPAPAKPAPDPALTVKLPDGSTVRAPNKVAADAVRNALTQLGVPYKWGGTKPGVGLDCSGLTQWAYDKAGKDIPRVSRDQDVGASISRADVKPGDLAVWNGHVAMVVGDGKMIEAGSPVELSPIRTTNERQEFYGFYRPTAS